MLFDVGVHIFKFYLLSKYDIYTTLNGDDLIFTTKFVELKEMDGFKF